ncbi:hypothetical protein DPMN_100325 [Dreissena polymorpha]|uniref:C2H2-type domain-containing protein n=1 Tax=Dreissena polymorpha TaxID=45954 RepID=A0A9D4R848_DREPO|nr:hypothetical protein DPMN_100325 [Dreissena polymorpha]
MIDVNQNLLVLGKNEIDMHCIGDVKHRPGRKHRNADGLNRIPCRQCGLPGRLNTVGMVRSAMTKDNVICGLCDKVFKKQDYMQKHLKIQHGIDKKADKKKSKDAMSTCSIGEDPRVELDFIVENEERFEGTDQNLRVGNEEVA